MCAADTSHNRTLKEVTRFVMLYEVITIRIFPLFFSSFAVYNPPPAGAVAGGVITTLLGLIILVLICIFGASKRDAQDPEPGSALSGSTTSPPHGVPESTGQIPS